MEGMFDGAVIGCILTAALCAFVYFKFVRR